VDMQAAIDSEPIKAELQDRELADFLFKAHMELGNYKLALEANDRLKEPNIETPATYYQACDAKARLGDFAGAKKDCELAQKMYQEINQPDVLALKNDLADQVKRGEITKAEAAQQLKEQLKEQSGSLPLAQSCYVRAALGDATGLAECERLIAVDAEDARAFEYLGLARSALKQVGNARQAYGQAIDLYQAQGNSIAVRRVQGLLKQLPGQ
jgi:tetratricopeptide (TPR) repeat protein